MEEGKREEAGIGIELGLKYSRVAVMWGRIGRAEIIPNDYGNCTTPSYVAFSHTRCFVGDAALSPQPFQYHLWRLIGRKFDDENVQRLIRQWPFKVIPTNDRKPLIVVSYKSEKKEFQAVEISAMIIRKLKQVAEAYLGSEVKNAVITVPASFSSLERQATKDAGVIAGLNVLRIICEPEAAAIAYGLDKKATDGGRRNVLVFDLGMETCKISLVNVEKGVLEIKSTCEDDSVGGQYFDIRLLNHFVDDFERNHGINISQNSRAMHMLRSACQKAKATLSSNIKTTIEIDSLSHGIDYTAYLSRALFNKLNYDLFEHCVSRVDKCLKDAKMVKADIHEIVLVGEDSRMHMMQQMLEEFFGKDLCKSIHPTEVVAFGAASLAAKISSTYQMDVTNIPRLLRGVDSLLKGFRGSKATKPIQSLPPRTKLKVVEMLSLLKLNSSDIDLMENVSLLLREIDIALPEHLRPALQGLEQSLVACHRQLLERAAEKKATFVDPQEVALAKADLADSKTRVRSSSSYCDRLKLEIDDVNTTIGSLIAKKTSLEKDLNSPQLKLVDLTSSLATQMESVKNRLKNVASYQDAEKLESNTRRSLGVAVDCLGSFVSSL